MKKELLEGAARLIDEEKDMAVASVSPEGYPRVCILSKLESKGLAELWFSTGTSGTKAGHFRANPKASVCAFRGGDSVTLVGRMEIVTDPAVKLAHFQEWMGAHFRGPNDPEYFLMRFVPESATVYIGGGFETDKL